jgi:hypothetical protein
MKLIEVKCKTCGKIKRITLGRFNQSKTKNFYCNLKCLNNSGFNNPNWKGGKPKCIDCGKVVIGGYKVKRCRKCADKFKKGQNSPSWKGGEVIVKCNTCGKSKKVKRFCLGRKTHFCNNKCRSIYMSKKYSGDGNPAWLGGISFLPYGEEFNDYLKKEIRNRDGYKCQGKDCGVPEAECLQNLTCHHIDYNKKNNSEVNLISLCHSCNAKVNSNRKHWEEYFTQLQISRIPDIIKRQNR